MTEYIEDELDEAISEGFLQGLDEVEKGKTHEINMEADDIVLELLNIDIDE